MKKFGVFLVTAALGALPLTAEAFSGHMGGGHPGMAMGHAGMAPHVMNRPAFGHGLRAPVRNGGFAFRRDGRFPDHAFVRHDHFFRHRHHRFVRSEVVFVGFGFPYYPYDYYPYPYDGYLYDYYPYDGYPYGSAETEAYPRDLAASVQTELARLGYYRGPIDGRLGPSTRRAIRAFQVAKRLPVTGYIDPKFLSTLERG